MRRLARGAAAALLAALLLPWIALAHAELASATPAPNSTLRDAPGAIVLTFTEDVDAATAAIDLLGATGQAIRGVGAVAAPAPTRLSVALPALEPGIYEVSYRVTSAVDGHVTTGVYAFRFDPTGTLPPPSGAATSASPSTDPLTVALRWASVVFLLTLFGAALFWLVAARPALLGREPEAPVPAPDPQPMAHRAPWRAFAARAAGALLSVLAFIIRSAAAVGSAPAHGLPIDPVAAFGWTPFAVAMRAVLVGSLLALALTVTAALVRRSRAPDTRPRAGDGRWLAALLVLVACAIGGFSFAGHAAAGGGAVFGMVDALHLVSVAAWLGTLAGLALLAARLRHDRDRRPAILADALRRHSRIAFLAAPVVALTGLANSPIVLGSGRELVASDYGNLVLAKAALFSIAVAIGSANFLLVRRRSLRRVALLVAAEAGIGLAAVAVAATMLSSAPSASKVPVVSQSVIQTAHFYARAGASTVHAAIDIPAPGDQLYQVVVADAASGLPRTDLQAVSVAFHPPAGSTLAERTVPLAPTVDPTVWAAHGAYTPQVGEWRIDVILRRAGPVIEQASFPIVIEQPLPGQLVPPPDTGLGVPAPLTLLWVLPGGLVGWLLVLVPLAGLAIVAWAGRSGTGWARRSGPVLPAIRLGLAAATVVLALGIGSRAVVEAANRPSGNPANPLPADAASIARGRLIYLANCSSCHGVSGTGDGPQAAGMLPPPGAIGSTVARLSDGQLQLVITSGLAGTPMPAFATELSENERWDVVNFLRSRWPSPTR